MDLSFYLLEPLVIAIEDGNYESARKLAITARTEIEMAKKRDELLKEAADHIDNYRWEKATAKIEEARAVGGIDESGIIRLQTLISFMRDRTALDGLAEIKGD